MIRTATHVMGMQARREPRRKIIDYFERAIITPFAVTGYQTIASAINLHTDLVRDVIKEIRREGKLIREIDGPLERWGILGMGRTPWARREQNHMMRRPKGATKRPCLCCGETFHSEGVHNRLCDGCKSESRGYDDMPLGGHRRNGIFC